MKLGREEKDNDYIFLLIRVRPGLREAKCLAWDTCVSQDRVRDLSLRQHL